MLGRANQAIPVGLDVLGRTADLRHDLGDLDRGNHFDGVPRADRQLVRVGLLGGDVDAHFTTHAPLDVDLAPRLHPFDPAVEVLEDDAVHGTDLQAAFAACAVVGVDDRQFLGKLFAG